MANTRPKLSSALSAELLAASRRFNKAGFSRSQTLSSGEFSHGEWHLMWLLLNCPDKKGARPSELARQQKVTAGNVAQQLRSLEKKGFVVRTHDTNDRRVVLVRLTPQGRKKMKQVFSEFVDQFQHLISHLGEKKARQLIRLLSDSADFLETGELKTEAA